MVSNCLKKSKIIRIYQRKFIFFLYIEDYDET